MGILLQPFRTQRILAVKIEDKHFKEVETVLRDNEEILRLLSATPNIKQEALAHINYTDLPPNGKSENVRAFLLQAREGMETIGFVSLYLGYPTNKIFYIGSLFFRVSFQKKGYGKEIVNWIEEELFKQGYEEGRVAVGLKNWPALRFWSKQGYDRISQIKGDAQYSPDSFGTIELCKCRNW